VGKKVLVVLKAVGKSKQRPEHHRGDAGLYRELGGKNLKKRNCELKKKKKPSVVARKGPDQNLSEREQGAK